MTDTPETTNVPAIPVEKRPSLEVGGSVGAIIPRNIEEGYRLATMICKAGLVPDAFRDSPEKTLVAIMQGMELGFTPMQALQCIFVTNGRPTIYGDGLMALARRHKHKIEEWLTGDGDKRVASCRVTRRDTGEVIERDFSWTDAKTAGLTSKKGPWTDYPNRMLQMRARGWALRDGLADELKGIGIYEEVADYPLIPNEPKTRDVTPAKALMQELGGHVTEDGEIIEG